MSQTTTITESEKVHTITSYGRVGRGKRGKVRNNTRDSVASINIDYKVEIEAFGAVLVLKYDKVELNKPFDVFK